MKPKLAKTELSFTRKDLTTIENLIVVRFKHEQTLKSPPEVLHAFIRGITQWVEETEEGKNLWNYTSEDLNIGDIIEEYSNKKLSKYLKKQGIRKWKPIYQLLEQEEVSYDKVLAAPQEKQIGDKTE